MNKMYTVILAVTIGVNLYGCANTLPLVSHAHVGHALTTWHDTPDQVGLYVSARNEASEALEIVSDQVDTKDTINQQQAVAQVAYILNPDLAPLDDAQFGQRYGVIRALEAVLDHIEYAATSDDASLNFLSSINELSKNGEQVIDQFKHIFEYTRQPLSSENYNSVLSRLYKDLGLAVYGKINQGEIVTYGMRNFTDDFNAMLKRERSPRYEPLPRKYVLGLVRLPNGHWGYKLNSGSSKYDDEYY